jgi:hypothetical protein
MPEKNDHFECHFATLPSRSRFPRVHARGRGFGRFASGELTQNDRFFQALEFCTWLLNFLFLEVWINLLRAN